MKEFSEIKENPKFQKDKDAQDGGSGWVTIKGQIFYVIYSNGGGWDHVSVSHRNRCPRWDEMCIIKDIFFNKNECCVEYHPAQKDYVNMHPNCLHIWKPQNDGLPKPPKCFV